MADTFDPTQFPALAAWMAGKKGTEPPPAPRNLAVAGLSAGTDELQALSGRGLQAFGDAMNLPSVAQVGADIAQRNFAEAAQNGRPDLEGGIFDEGLLGAPKRAGYQFFKQVPQIGASLLAAKLFGPGAASMIAEEGAAARLGAQVPKFLGGGGLRAGATAAEQKLALEEGRRFAAGTLGAAPVMYPQAVGSMYDEALSGNNGGQKNAAAALGLGVPYSLLEGLEPGSLSRFIAKGAEGNVLKRAVTRALGVAPTEAVTEGVQTAMEQSFRPDLSTRDKAANIVNAAVTGGIVGGMFGGVAGIVGGRTKTADPKVVSDDDLKGTIDQALGTQQQLPGIAPQEEGVGQQTFDPNTRQLRPFAGASDEELQQRLAAVQQRGVLNNEMSAQIPGMAPVAANKQDMTMAQLLRAEMDRRAQPPEQGYDPQRQMNLFAADNAAMPEQRAPSYVGKTQNEQLSEAEAKSRTYAENLLGDAKSKWAQEIIQQKAVDETDVHANVIQTINTLDEAGANIPSKLKQAAEKLGLMDNLGRPRDIRAELDAAKEQQEVLWRRAKEKGIGQGEATAQQKKVRELQSKVDALDAAQQRIEQRSAQATQQAAEAAEAVPPKSAAESAEVLAGAPPLTPAPTFEQRFRQRGIAPEGVAPEGIVEEPAPIPIDRSGTQYQSLEQRFRNPVAPMQAAVAPEPAPQARVAQALGITPAPVAPTQVVTATQTPPKTQAEAKARSNAAQFAPTMQQRFATRGGITQQGAPSPATDIQQGSQRAAAVQQLKVAKLARIAQDDSVGPDMQRAASEAHAAMQAFQPGAEDAMDQVLSEHAERTGDMVFSTRRFSERQPPMSDRSFDQSLLNIARKLPRTAREAIYVVNTAGELPVPVQMAASRQNMHPNEIRGVMYDGNVYVVKDQVSSEADLQEVINHEVFGHGGARALLGDQRKTVMGQVFQMVGGLEGLRSLARYYGVERALNEYLPGRDLTPDDQVALTDEMLAQVAGKATGKFKTFALAWMSRFKSGLIKVLQTMGLNRAAERLNTFDAADLAEMLVRMREAVESGAPISGEGVQFMRATPQGMIEATKGISDAATKFKEMIDARAPTQETSLGFNRFTLYTSTVGHIVDFYKNLFDMKDAQGNVTNGLTQYLDANRARGTTEQRLAHLAKKVYSAYELLQRDSKEAAGHVGKLMGYTFWNVDPRRTWDEQPWLHQERNADILKKHATEANALYRRISAPNSKLGKAAQAVYHDFINVNEAFHLAQQAVSLYNIMATDEGVSQQLKDSIQNPMDEFLADPKTYDSAKDTRTFWQAKADDLASRAKQYVAEQRGLTDIPDEAQRDKINRSTSAIAARLADMSREQEAMQRAPYFHIGRFGNYVLSFHVKAQENGGVDPAALERVAKAFSDAGIEGIEIPTEGVNRANVFIRFENLSQRDEARRVAEKLAQSGDVLHNGDKEIKTFDSRDEKYGVDMNQAPVWAQRLMDHIRATPIGGNAEIPGVDKKTMDAINGAFQRHIQEFFLNQLPETAINKVMVHRNSVPGFSSDMIRSYLFRTQVGGRALANLYASAKMADATKLMTQVARDARADSDTKTAQIKQNVVTELFKREANRPGLVRNDFIDTLRAANHAYFLGMSPSYVAVNMTQLGVLLWPELAKKHSFVKAAKTIGSVTPQAFKIMKAALTEASKLGFSNLADASITRQSLQNAGIDEKTANFVMRVVNSGLIDIGSQSREIGRIIEGKANDRTEQALRWASAAGYYSEMLTRLIAALAARDLHGGSDENMYKYVDETVRQSMLSYETWNQARATGRMGIAGQLTPVMTSFMQYTFQLTEKLFRELYAGFTNGRSDAEKREARRFLGAHLAAITTLAGSLGMPMAAVFAGVFDKLKDELWKDENDEPSNIQADWRNFLSDTFGQEVGEVLARGVPRAFGIDVSRRAGEQDLLPYGHMFTRLLTDRRKWDDVVKDWALDTLGSPVSMVSNVIQGGGQILGGDPLKGMQTMVPLAIRGPVNAYRLTTEGYTDNMGNKMPMTPGAGAVLAQALGFTPAAKAEYSEARGVQQTLKGDQYRRGSLLRRNLVMAIEAGDKAAAREALLAARDFDKANPQFQILPRIGSVLQSRAASRARAQAAGTPLGIDPLLADRSRFANFN